MVSHSLINTIALSFLFQDIKCGLDLTNGLITSENDYTSSFITRIRDDFPTSFPRFCLIKRLSIGEEEVLGADGVCVFRHSGSAKVGAFEAKLIDRKNWDRKRHFSGQLVKQSGFKNQIVFWEMFYHKNYRFKFIPSFCIWFDDAFRYDKIINRNWTNKRISKLLCKKSIDIYQVIFQILSCYKGRKVSIDSETNSIIIKGDDRDQVKIPLPPKQIEGFDDKLKIIRNFMDKYGLTSYLYFDLDRE